MKFKIYLPNLQGGIVMITTAIEKNGIVYVYGPNRNVLFMRNGRLYGFTSTTVSILNNKTVMVYDERGRVISQHNI